MANWNMIDIDSENSLFANINVYYYSEEEPDIDGIYWHYASGKPAIWREITETDYFFKI